MFINKNLRDMVDNMTSNIRRSMFFYLLVVECYKNNCLNFNSITIDMKTTIFDALIKDTLPYVLEAFQVILEQTLKQRKTET